MRFFGKGRWSCAVDRRDVINADSWSTVYKYGQCGANICAEDSFSTSVLSSS